MQILHEKFRMVKLVAYRNLKIGVNIYSTLCMGAGRFGDICSLSDKWANIVHSMKIWEAITNAGCIR